MNEAQVSFRRCTQALHVCRTNAVQPPTQEVHERGTSTVQSRTQVVHERRTSIDS